MSALHIVTGAGPVGTTIAQQLAAAGDSVRILTRSGSGPSGSGIERRAVDVRDESALTAALDGAQSIFHCIHAAYDLKSWERELPVAEQIVMRAAGDRVVVFPESLYSYADSSVPMTEASPRTASTGKRGLRARLLDARAASTTPTISVMASDFFGPEVRNAHAGERLVPALLAGKRVRVLGSADVPHSFTYVPDLARAMITAAHDRNLWDTVLHAPTGPALTQRQLAEAIAAAAGVSAKIGTIPSWVVRAGATVSTPMRELAEMLYQFERPFVLDSSRSEQLLGQPPTPLPEAVRSTLVWWHRQLPATVAASAEMINGDHHPVG